MVEHIIDLETQELNIIIKNNGIGSANIKEFEISNILKCPAYDTIVQVLSLNTDGCINKTLTGKNTETNNCTISFKVKFDDDDIREKSVSLPPPIRANCSLISKIYYTDEFTEVNDSYMLLTDSNYEPPHLLELEIILRLP